MDVSSGPPTLDEVKHVSSIEEAMAIQVKIEPLVCIPADKDHDDQQARVTILALDVAYSTKSDLIVASGVLYRLNRKEGDGDNNISEKVLSGKAHFPYIPGLLAFRELPILASVIEALLSNLREKNEDIQQEKNRTILLCDGAGIAHPRLCGIACHLGVLYNLPSIGVAKNHLIGTTFDEEVDAKRGSHSTIYVEGRRVGSVLRSQDEIRPVFVSPGHLISINDARKLVLDLCHKYRLPEPIRRADHIGRLELKRLEALENVDGVEKIAKPTSTSSFIHGQEENNSQREMS